MRTHLALALAAMLLLSALVTAEAGASSILYRKNHALWVASPSGKHERRIKGSRGFSNPSQDDRGRIVAQKGVRLYRLNRVGNLLNKPITTAFRTNPVVPSFKGPFFPEVSPNGKLIAYTYSFTESHYDPECDCVSTAPSLPTQRPTIHSRTRMLSPKPGHRNLPSAPLRNQLTWKTFGSFIPGLSTLSQWAK